MVGVGRNTVNKALGFSRDPCRRGAGWTSEPSRAEWGLDRTDGAARSPFSPAAQCFYNPRRSAMDAAAKSHGGFSAMLLHDMKTSNRA